jgi:hypothetical protein
MTIMVDINYINPLYQNQAKGFTLSTYSRYALSITNQFGGNFQQNVNGQSPSGFMNPPQIPQGVTPSGNYFAAGETYTGALAPLTLTITDPIIPDPTKLGSYPSTISIKSLIDCMIQSRDIKMFFELI